MIDVSTSSESQLTRVIGIRALTASTINTMIAASIFLLPAKAANSLGPSAPAGYLICAVLMGLIMACFAMAGSRVSLTGGPYAYVELAFGPYVGFVAGILLWSGNVLGVAAVANGLVDTLGEAVPPLKAVWLRPLLLTGFFSVVAWPNLRGTKPGVRFIEWMTFLKLVPILLVLMAGITFLTPSRFEATGAHLGTGGGAGLLVIFFAFTGAELALIPSGEVRNARTTVPWAMGVSIVCATLLYLGVHQVALGVLGAQLAESKAPVAQAAQALLGGWAGGLILVGSAVSMFGLLCGDMLSTPRILFALARDGFLTPKLARIHPRFKSPHIAIVVHAILLSVLSSSGGFEWLADQSSVVSLLLYFLCCLAAWQLSRGGAGGGASTGSARWLQRIIPWSACALIVWVLTRVDWPMYVVAGGVVAVASLLYRWRKPSTPPGSSAEGSKGGQSSIRARR